MTRLGLCSKDAGMGQTRGMAPRVFRCRQYLSGVAVTRRSLKQAGAPGKSFFQLSRMDQGKSIQFSRLTGIGLSAYAGITVPARWEGDSSVRRLRLHDYEHNDDSLGTSRNRPDF